MTSEKFSCYSEGVGARCFQKTQSEVKMSSLINEWKKVEAQMEGKSQEVLEAEFGRLFLQRHYARRIYVELVENFSQESVDLFWGEDCDKLARDNKWYDLASFSFYLTNRIHTTSELNDNEYHLQ